MKRGRILSAFVFAGAAICSSPAWGQFADPGGSPSENLRNRGAMRPGIRVREGIAQHTFGPEITQQVRPGPQYGLELQNEFFRNFFASLTALVNLLPQILNPGDGGPSVPGGGGSINDVVMTELSHDGNVAFVELLNRSPIRISLAGFAFSDGRLVSPRLPPFEIERDVTFVVQFGGDRQADEADVLLGFRLQSIPNGELALYDFSGLSAGEMPIEDADRMIDYIQWNDDDQQRDPTLESIASAASLWSTVDAIPASLSNRTFRLTANAEGRQNTTSGDFIVNDFSQNTLGLPESLLSLGGDGSGTGTDGGDGDVRDRLR